VFRCLVLFFAKLSTFLFGFPAYAAAVKCWQD